MPTLTQAMNDAKIETVIKRTDAPVKADKWQRSAYHYAVTFTIRSFKGVTDANTRSLTVPFSTGNGWDREPSAAEVMRCVLSDAMDVHPQYGHYRFEPWAEEFGYDTDSRAAEKTFKACQDQLAELEDFLTRGLLDTWLDDTELQDSESTDTPTGRAIKKIKPQDRKF